MPEPEAGTSALNAGSFVSLLAALAGPAPVRGTASDGLPDWKDGELAEDIATLSYEQALRTHGRARPAEAEVAGSREIFERKTQSEIAVGESRKAASITIRVTKAECAQLHARAAEAGLTVSAYLRSCAFEVEALRAEVKEAVAQLRRGERVEEKQTVEMKAVEAEPISATGWRVKLFPRWMGVRRAEA